jgi:hypothetical protein
MPKRRTAHKPSSEESPPPVSNPPDPAADLVNHLAALPNADRGRFGALLAAQSTGSGGLLPGYAVLDVERFRFLLDSAYNFTDRAFAGENCLAQAMELLKELKDFAGELLTTRQRKRGPTQQTRETIEKIRQMRAEGQTWRRIDRALSLTPGTARTLLHRGKKYGA